MSPHVAVAEASPGTPATPPRRRLRAGATAAAFAAAAVAAGLAVWLLAATPGQTPTATTFQVVDHPAGVTVYERELRVGERFRLEHTHSVTRRPIIETFSVPAADTLALEELWFDEPGPNLPAGPEQMGGTTTTFTSDDGAFRVLHHGHEIGTLPLMVGGADVDHVLEFADGERLRLLDVTRSGSRVELLVGGSR